jgi:hypothetical protein
MANQYTECIDASQYTNFNHMLVATIQGLLVGLTGTALLVRTARWDCWPYLLLVTGIAGVIAYCRLFLYARLICLGGDRDCVGAVISVSGTTLTGLPDNDFNINLLLEGNEFGAKRPAVENSTPYGYLVKAQDVVTERGIATAGHESTDHATQTVSECLHCEFEGGGVYYLLLGSYAGFAAAIGALLLCVYLPPIPGLQQIIMVLWILALILVGLGALVGLFSGGDTDDVNPNLGDIHTNSDPNAGLGAGADILYVQGTWVFDPWHEGWNEIHPVKVCTRIGKWDGDWDTQPPDIILRVRNQFEIAGNPATQAAQQRPEHGWSVHPSLDACAPEIIT